MNPPRRPAIRPIDPRGIATTALAAALAALSALAAASPAVAAPTRGEQWWAHVQALAADDMRGRQTGSVDFDRASEYVIARFREAGLQPAGTDGFRQPVLLEEQRIDSAASTAALTSTAGTTVLTVGDELIVSAGAPRPATVDAPMVFAGYGLHMPEAGHDDFAGLDIRGKIVVVISGGPANVSGALKSHARSDRNRLVAERGGLGIITINTPRAVEIPWERARLLGRQPGMYPADAGVRDVRGTFLGGAFDAARGELLFQRSGHRFADVAALADASRPIAGFPLGQSLRAGIVTTRAAVKSYNLLAMLPGGDPALRGETVALSAHLDHLGVGAAIGGDAIYNGAMDDASGVAALIEIARKYRADGVKPKRSILFAVVTAEEKGLLGSRFLAERPTPAAGRIVANLNFDMPLPLWRLEDVLVLGADESSIGGVAARIAAARSLRLVPDAMPDRNAFIRSDQYSFVRAGIPAVAFKFGFARDTPQAEIEKAWRATRYHSPSDDLAQPVEKEEMVKLDDFVGALALELADAPQKPSWNAASFFRRFVR